MSARPVSALPQGTAITRLWMLLAKTSGDPGQAHQLAAGKDIAEFMLEVPQVKGAIAAMTAGAASAAAITNYGLDAEMMVLLNSQSVFAKTFSRMRRWPFRVRVPKQTGEASGGWVGMGAPIPVSAAQLSVGVLERYRAGSIVVVDRELLKVGDPACEAAVRQIMAAGVGAFVDAQFLDPSVAAVAEVNPASITNNATAIQSGGTSAEILLADFASVAGAVTTDGAGLTWFMRHSVAKKLAAKYTASGLRLFPDLNLSDGGRIFGIKVELSRNVPAALGSPSASIVILADLDLVAAADDGAEVSGSTKTTIDMSSAPTSPSPPVSMFQTHSATLKTVRAVSWIRLQDGAVAYLNNLAL